MLRASVGRQRRTPPLEIRDDFPGEHNPRLSDPITNRYFLSSMLVVSLAGTTAGFAVVALPWTGASFGRQKSGAFEATSSGALLISGIKRLMDVSVFSTASAVAFRNLS